MPNQNKKLYFLNYEIILIFILFNNFNNFTNIFYQHWKYVELYTIKIFAIII